MYFVYGSITPDSSEARDNLALCAIVTASGLNDGIIICSGLT
jgi:hypothetical protein